jgi:hypothetical protein
VSVRARLPRLLAAALAALGLLFAAEAARGQEAGTGGLRPAVIRAFTGTGSGVFATSVTMLPERESLESEAREARIRLGPLRLRPTLSIGNLGYTNNFFGETDEEREGDFTATVRGGVRAIVPVGSRLFLKGSVLPTYSWYSKNADRRQFGGTYDASALFYLSRFALQVQGASEAENVDLSSEVEQPVEQKVLSGVFRGQYELGSRTAIVGDVRLSRRRYGGAGFSDDELAMLRRLDGTDTIWSVGVRRKVGARLSVGVSYEQGDLSFANEGELRDARSTGILGSAFLDRSRLDVNVFAGFRKLEPKAGSSFEPYDGPSGGAQVTYAATRLVSLGAFARSSFVSSLYGENAFYDERRVGATIGISPRWASLLVAFEVGTNKYPGLTVFTDGSSARRNDDVTTLRGRVTTRLGRLLNLGVDVSQSKYDSNLPGLDRSVFRVGTTIGLGLSGSIDLIK